MGVRYNPGMLSTHFDSKRWCVRVVVLAMVLSCCGLASIAAAQSQVVDVTVHSPGLEHNLLGDPADQNVSIYLPEAYGREPQRRFPVLYFLHGYSDPMPRHEAAENMRATMDGLIATGAAQPFIIVLPNGLNKYRGSFYANSSTTGNWDDYITKDVVGYVDAHYRTLATVEHRAIAGHSMGGYGALTLAFRHPDVFSAVYAMSPCCTDLIADSGPSNPAWIAVREMKSPDDVPAALKEGHFFNGAFAAMTAALAPDPNAKTLGDLPFTGTGRVLTTDPAVFEQIASKMPANMVFPLLPKIAQLRGIYIEYGAQENFTHIIAGARETAQRLSEAGIPNTLEVFTGDHGNHFDQRVKERVLPWVSGMIAERQGPGILN
jgi:S-formylglutathione hydrolase